MTQRRPPNRRERLRAQTVADIKGQGLAQLVSGGVDQVSLNALARTLGMSTPALYRYFASRDDLLTALAADGWNDLADTLAAAAAAGRGSAPDMRLRRVVAAFRSWALARPNLYWLVFTSRYGSGLLDGGDVAAAAQRCMAVNIELVSALMPPDPGRATSPDLDGELAQWRRDRVGAEPGVSPAILELAVLLWTRFHGLISVEVQGGFASMGLDPDLLVEAEVQHLVAAAAGQR